MFAEAPHRIFELVLGSGLVARSVRPGQFVGQPRTQARPQDGDHHVAIGWAGQLGLECVRGQQRLFLPENGFEGRHAFDLFLKPFDHVVDDGPLVTNVARGRHEDSKVVRGTRLTCGLMRNRCTGDRLFRPSRGRYRRNRRVIGSLMFRERLVVDVIGIVSGRVFGNHVQGLDGHQQSVAPGTFLNDICARDSSTQSVHKILNGTSKGRRCRGLFFSIGIGVGQCLAQLGFRYDVRETSGEYDQHAEGLTTDKDRPVFTDDLPLSGIDLQCAQPESVLDRESHVPFPAASARLA